MCGRASITKSEAQIESRFDALFYPEELEGKGLFPNQNICPSQLLPIITNIDPRHINLYRWGLIPHWAKNEKVGYKMFNARKETLLNKPAFSQAVTQRRCLVIMDSFYEWKKVNSQKVPHRIFLKDQPLFTAAGLWESWLHPAGNTIHSCTVITQPPNNFMSHLHDRMPAILTVDQEQLWIDNNLSAAEAIKLLDEPIPSEMMDSYEMDPVTGRLDNTGKQMSLF